MFEIAEEELHLYNKRCAEFLGCTFKIKALFEFDKDKETVFIEQYSKPFWWNSVYEHTYGFLSYQETRYMRYHSDWNWIMEVLQKILAITFSDSEEETSDSETFYLIRDCIPDKEHIVRTINQFLIQYNENTTK